MSVEPRHEFYETEEKVSISIFDKGANPEEVSVKFTPESLTYENGEMKLELHPLTAEIDPATSDYTVGKVKVEVRLAKKAPGRWTRLVKDPSAASPATAAAAATSSAGSSSSAAPGSNTSFARRPPAKNWEALSDDILKADKAKTASDDPNAVDSNSAFASLFANVDDDAKRAIMKSYIESGGTTLSTDWSDVKKGPVPVKPPEGQEWRKWG